MAEESAASTKARAVWRAVAQVPRGKVASYGDIAELAGCTARQVGWALRKASPALRLPWHRILRSDGSIALPEQGALEQRLRLEAEGVTFRGRRVRMELHRWEIQ